MCVISSFAQKDVTKFLGFPVDGTKSEMIKNLESKGFKLTNTTDKNVLSGQFNGSDVLVFIVTENDKVSRIAVVDNGKMNETDIRIRFNRLCSQFKDNGKYMSLKEDCTIPEGEDISYGMRIRNKRYEACFFQLPDEDVMEQMQNDIVKEILSKYTPEQIGSLSTEAYNDLISSASTTLRDRIAESIKNKSVWLMISEMDGEYYITILYDNEYNRAKGEDL